MIDTYDGPLQQAEPFMSVALCLEADLDVSRGDAICCIDNQPEVSRSIEAHVCWMHERPMVPGGRYLIKHTTRNDDRDPRRVPLTESTSTASSTTRPPDLKLDQIGRVSLRTRVPLIWDEYLRNRTTGSFILIDESTTDTLGAGMILGGLG